MEDFEYVVFKRPPPKVAFGSGLLRGQLARTGFMRRFSPAENPKTGPGVYEAPQGGAFYDSNTKPRSLRGIGERAPRCTAVHQYQPPPQPVPPPRPCKHNCAPFNSTTKRKNVLGNHNPSPCDYNALYKPKKMRYLERFGGKKTLLCAVEIKCVPYNLDACEVCHRLCSPQGDYWHFENRVFLCRKHYARLYTHALAKINGNKLAEFKSIRDCFFAHMHNSCVASVKLMTRVEIENILRKEAYLDLYFPQRKKYA